MFVFQSTFEIIDKNKDGTISLQEWLYTIVNHQYCSGPENPDSFMCGAILD